MADFIVLALVWPIAVMSTAAKIHVCALSAPAKDEPPNDNSEANRTTNHDEPDHFFGCRVCA
jgi:hypothetical protein